MSAKTTTGSVVLTHDVGLHARPSVKLTKLAKTFASRIELAVENDGPWIDAKSIVKVMAAKAPKDTVLHFRAEGEDAKAAVDALIRLVASDFEDAPAGEPGDVAHAGTG
jgi:phosphocarrier protein